MTGETAALDWPKLKIGMLGGDKREQEIARRAAATGAEVRACGFPWPEQGISGVQHLTPTSIETLLKIVVEDPSATGFVANACVVGPGTVGSVRALALVALGL